jgi:hypothetical protein
MATDKPRITITLEPHEHATLQRLAKLQGGSMSGILREFMGEVIPILSKVADSLEAAKRASSDARAKFVRAAEEAEEELRPIAEFVRDQFDTFANEIGRLVDEEVSAPTNTSDAGKEAGRRKRASPRSVITGATEVQRRSKSTSPRAK